MTRRLALLAACCVLATTVGCSGIRSSSGHYTAHAESFRLLFIPIPHNDQRAALELAERKHPNGEVITLVSSPSDFTSFVGFFRGLLGFHGTIVSGTTGE